MITARAMQVSMGSPWLLSRGNGELLALRPDDMLKPYSVPNCRLHPGERTPMHYRPDGWACYRHEPPFRLPLDLRLQEIPPFEGDWQKLIGKTVDLVYSKGHDEREATWKYDVAT